MEGAIREHYEATGGRDFEADHASSAASTAPEREAWIFAEENSAITGSTVNLLEVERVSGETAPVDVSFEDKTGTPRFLITWSLINEDGGWKLERQLSAERLE